MLRNPLTHSKDNAYQEPSCPDKKESPCPCDIAWIEIAARSKQLHVDIDDEDLDIIISSQDRSKEMFLNTSNVKKSFDSFQRQCISRTFMSR